MQKMITIIVPVYNVEIYLRKCIDSVIGQTYKNLQIILVDDGSTDLSGKICDDYALSDKRIQVIHKENGGLVSARKAGTVQAKGEFVLNIDSDDWVENDYIEKLVNAQISSQADIVACDLFMDIGECSNRIKNYFSVGIYETANIVDRLVYSGNFFEYGIQPHLVTKLIKRDILLKHQKNVDQGISAGEDAAVIYPCVLEADNIYIADICGYHYIQHTSSITKRRYDDEQLKLNMLVKYLTGALKNNRFHYDFTAQLDKYDKYIRLLRSISSFDENRNDKWLVPYGGIEKEARIVVYGAGGVGQELQRYISSTDKGVLVYWVDMNYEFYQKNGFDVVHPSVLTDLTEYDYIIIANISKNAASAIREYLLSMEISDKPILWFDSEFLES